MNSKKLGGHGEEIAAQYLKQNNYKILDRNFPRRIRGVLAGELDIVAQFEETICFVEVKALSKTIAFWPEDRVDFKKKQRLKRSAESWLVRHKIPLLGIKWQIDIITVSFAEGSSQPKIEHFRNVIDE